MSGEDFNEDELQANVTILLVTSFSPEGLVECLLEQEANFRQLSDTFAEKAKEVRTSINRLVA